MAIGISPLVDFVFKLLLGSPEHSRVTIHFLNAILVGHPRITSVQFLNPFLGKQTENDKLAVLDILATDEHGRLLNIEVQTSLPVGMSQRLTYYVSNIYASQLYEGDPYRKLRPAISICVLSRSMFPKSTGLHLDFRLREASGKLTLTDDLQIHLLQLNHLQVTAENVYNASPAERWAWFLLNADKLTSAEIRRLFPDEEFLEAAGVLEMISQTPEQMMLYNARLKMQLDNEARLYHAREEALEEGMEKGLEKGLEEGREKGLEEGLEKGEQIGRIKAMREVLGLRPFTAD
jgi:predicted transposase/invertase (TIGR01784 family)